MVFAHNLPVVFGSTEREEVERNTPRDQKIKTRKTQTRSKKRDTKKHRSRRVCRRIHGYFGLNLPIQFKV